MDFVTPYDPSMLRSKAEVGVLSADVAGEGERIIHSDGETVAWLPPPAKAVIPDWSGIKSLRRYFGSHVHRTYPAWLYHPTEEPRLVKNAEEASLLGVGYRTATNEERGKYRVENVWDHTADSKWRAEPWPGTMKFDPRKAGHGKTYQPTAPNPVHAQNDLVRALIPEVAAAVAQALKSSGPSAPANVNPKDWDEFLAFQAWQKTQSAVEALATEDNSEQGSSETSNALSKDEERKLWEAEAARKNIRVDGRWSLEKLREAVEKAA